MPNIAAALKSEISRIVRKRFRGEAEDINKASIQHRSHIAAFASAASRYSSAN
ncbi:MAG: hypothetical protein JWN34_5921 [Bryobacterales bacterium]|nr:hypothetical protein [Bryobacterales bacterium]